MAKHIYSFERKSTKAWSWTRLKKVRQYYWVCYVYVFGEKQAVAWSGEVVHNREDRNEALEDFIQAVKDGRYTKKDVEDDND